MLNFRNTNLFFTGLLIILAAVHVRYGLPFYSYLLVALAYSLVVFYGCYYVGSGFFIKIICAARTDKKEIAISFDDGPVASTTEIIRLLREDGIKATFFCIGSRIAGNEAILAQLKEEGHIIGNHSFSHHFWFDLFSSRKMLDDLKQMDGEVERVTGLRPKLFRPPYGVTNPNLKKAIIEGGYTPVGWSVRSMDTVIQDEDKLLRKITGSIRPGAVFLFHDTSRTMINVLPRFIQEVKNRGYQVVSLDKLLHLTPYA